VKEREMPAGETIGKDCSCNENRYKNEEATLEILHILKGRGKTW